jgi:hypothetical protein
MRSTKGLKSPSHPICIFLTIFRKYTVLSHLRQNFILIKMPLSTHFLICDSIYIEEEPCMGILGPTNNNINNQL